METTGMTLGILLLGIITVLGSILILRLHAFLALVLGALLVGLLTPSSTVERQAIERTAIPVLSIDSERAEVTLRVRERPGMIYLIARRDPGTGRFDVVGELQIERTEDATVEQSVARIRRLPHGGMLRPDDVVIHPMAYEAANELSRQTVGERVTNGFGDTCAKIGILIAMASIIGKCLLDSGAADRIVRSLLHLFGERGAPRAFLTSGFLLGIPVFFDTVFYLMIPLGKALRLRTGRHYLLYVLTIVAGATMAHSLVPPTPGPLFVAEELGVDIGVMILAGCGVGLFTITCGYLYASFVGRAREVPLRPSSDFSLEEIAEISRADESRLPPFWISILPIALPVFLIGGFTLLKELTPGLPPGVKSLVQTLGNKNFALALSAAVALVMLAWKKRNSLQELATSVQSALASGGIIILITASGGAFGRILQQTGVASLVRELPSASPLLIIATAFLITTAVRTVQGSATVAMITAVGILSEIGDAEALGFHPVYLALAIGCGSKPIQWMNDSGFWVICKMSGMTEGETLKYVTPLSALMGIVGLIVTMVAVTVFPMA